jgi:integrase
MAKAHRLTDSKVRSFKPHPRKDRWENDGNGLYMRVRPNGTKTWVLRRKVRGKTKKKTLGVYDDLGLRDARIEAAVIRKKDKEQIEKPEILNGSPTTFGELLNQYYDERIKPNYERPRQVRMYIDNRVPDDIKDMVISDLDEYGTRQFRVATRTWLSQYAKSSGPVGANRLLAIFKQTTKFGTAIGYLTVDPLRELTRKLVGGTEKPGDRTLTNEEIKKLWHAESPHLPLFRFLLLTGQRIGEAQLANWTDIEGERWLIPAANSKNKKAQWFPITDPINKVLSILPHNRTKIFATRSTTGTQSWLKRWCEREGIDPRFTPHDLRRTFVTELNELGVEPYVIEKLVNHSMSGVMAVYNKAEYAEGRIGAARLWSDHVISIVEDQPVKPD